MEEEIKGLVYAEILGYEPNFIELDAKNIEMVIRKGRSIRQSADLNV